MFFSWCPPCPLTDRIFLFPVLWRSPRSKRRDIVEISNLYFICPHNVWLCISAPTPSATGGTLFEDDCARHQSMNMTEYHQELFHWFFSSCVWFYPRSQAIQPLVPGHPGSVGQEISSAGPLYSTILEHSDTIQMMSSLVWKTSVWGILRDFSQAILFLFVHFKVPLHMRIWQHNQIS